MGRITAALALFLEFVAKSGLSLDSPGAWYVPKCPKMSHPTKRISIHLGQELAEEVEGTHNTAK